MKKSIFIMMIALAAFTGCSKSYLDEAPKLSQSNELSLNSYKNINLAVAGAYSPLVSTDWYGEDFVLTTEMRTPDAKKWIGSAHDSGRLNDDYSVFYTPSTTSGLWGTAYYQISAVNNILDAIPNVAGDEQAMNNLKAECLFLRALAHFDLVRTFAMPYNYTADASHLGVPVVLHTDMQGAPARNTVKEVYDQVIADLVEAESIIDPTYTRSGVTDSYATANIYAIEALLARAYQYSEQWQKAADEATKVISSGKFKIWSSADYKTVWTEAKAVAGGEIIFETYGSATNGYDGYFDSLPFMTDPTGYGDGGASPECKALYADGDVRGTLFKTDADGACLWTSKWDGKGLASVDVTNFPVLRLSEMYLIRAEATIHGASVKGASAVSDISAVATARGAVPESATLTGVYLEAQKEFAWEGHLWFDLARTKRDCVRDAAYYVGTAANRVIPAGDYKWAMPIAQRELNVNANLVQNEGYSK